MGKYSQKSREYRSKVLGVVQQEKPCLQCWETFLPTQAGQKCCSEVCRKKRNYEQVKEWHKTSHLQPSGYYRTRFDIFKRDNFACQYCGGTAQDGAKLHIDHVIPRHSGGSTEKDNLITACQQCNMGKSDVLLDEHQEAKYKKLIEKEN